MSIDPVTGHFGNWFGVALWIVVFVGFLAFTPFYKKSSIKPSSAYVAFVVALALEMFGVPLSMYVIAAVFGASLPDGVLWGTPSSTTSASGAPTWPLRCTSWRPC